MCYFHIAVFYEKNEKRWSMYKSIIKSFFLYPRGYNGKTNKPMLVMLIYNFPIFGKLLKTLGKK